jgi:hypothetical protein
MQELGEKFGAESCPSIAWLKHGGRAITRPFRQ